MPGHPKSMPSLLRVSIPPATLSGLCAQEPGAQAEAFRLFSGPVYTMAQRILGDRHMAEEVTQETFIDVFTKVGSLREPERFAAWVRSVAVNRCLMVLRSPWQSRRAPEDFDEPAAELEDVTRGHDVLTAFDSLESDARMVVWLYCVEGYGHDEIAALFYKSVSFSKSRLQRALATLSRRCDPSELVAVSGKGD